jgi:hypothetical protein
MGEPLSISIQSEPDIATLVTVQPPHPQPQDISTVILFPVLEAVTQAHVKSISSTVQDVQRSVHSSLNCISICFVSNKLLVSVSV